MNEVEKETGYLFNLKVAPCKILNNYKQKKEM